MNTFETNKGFTLFLILEYPKIVQLLKGILTPVHAEHRQLLQNSAKAIFHRLSVAEILPILYQKKVLNQNDLDELRSTERTHSRGAAATDLLFILPNRHQDWFELFLLALIESGQKELAEIIDSETTGSMFLFCYVSRFTSEWSQSKHASFIYEAEADDVKSFRKPLSSRKGNIAITFTNLTLKVEVQSCLVYNLAFAHLNF